MRYTSLAKVRWLKLSLKEIKPEILPEAETVDKPEKILDFIQAPISHYHQYRCLQGNPLNCREPPAKRQPNCQHCTFPATLPEGGQLFGKQGQYQIGCSLGQRGIGRLYEGIRLSSEEPVVIQEYLLPKKYFNVEEQRHYQESFTTLAGLSLADGRIQDARIVLPLEAIADSSGERCYLVTSSVDSSPTLNRYCASHGPFDSKAILSMLNQVLQTLVFLHQQKFALPAGQVQEGIIHGNLSLDSLLWVANPNEKDTEGFVYLTDFALWERLFDPVLVDRGQPNYQDDLAALGQVAFFLLNGAAVNNQEQSLKSHLDSDWPDTYTPLKLFVRRLIGLDPPFASAEAARAELLAMPPETILSQWEHRETERLPIKQAWYKRCIPILIVAAILTGLGGIGWLLLRSLRPTYANTLLPSCCLDEIDAVPMGDYRYAIPASAYWYPLFRSAAESSPETSPTLFDQLQTLHPDLALMPHVTGSVESAIASVQSGQTDVAIVPLTEQLPADITGTIIAYDSLVPVVAFNYPERTKGLPHALNGEITLSELEQLYTGEIDNWQQLNTFDLKVKRYWTDDPIVERMVAQRIFDAPQEFETRENPSSSSTFINSTFINIEEPNALPTLTMLRWILQDFENTTVGSIGIAPLSQVFGQCSVYPLALAETRKSVAPLVFDDGKTMGPEEDLCDRKGSYQPNALALRSGAYPLAYPLAVIYPFDNSRSPIGKKLAELLLTQESQTYLTSLGMVSAYPF